MNDAIETVRLRVGFHRFELDLRSLTPDEEKTLDHLPSVGDNCRVRTFPNMKSSAFGQMSEYGLVAGFLRTDVGIKALVIYTERPLDENENSEFGFVELRQLKPMPVKKLK